MPLLLSPVLVVIDVKARCGMKQLWIASALLVSAAMALARSARTKEAGDYLARSHLHCKWTTRSDPITTSTYKRQVRTDEQSNAR